MKILLSVAMAVIAFTAVPRPADDAHTAYMVGYIVGGQKMKAGLARQGHEIRDAVKAKLQPRLLFFAVAAVAVTLCGPEIAERLRRRVKAVFKISKRTEVALTWLGYLAVTAGIIAYSLVEYGIGDSAPLAILLAGTVWPFAQILKGIRDDDRTLRKSGVGKIKTLWFLCLVVAMVYRLLSGGIANIKVG